MYKVLNVDTHQIFIYKSEASAMRKYNQIQRRYTLYSAIIEPKWGLLSLVRKWTRGGGD